MGWNKAQAGIKISGKNINNLRYTDDTTLLAESEEELNSLLMKVKAESLKAGLKLNIQKTEIMASCPIISWQIDGETMETVTDFIFCSSKITADGDCSHGIKTPAPWKKSYDQPKQHIKKQRHYFGNKCPSSQSYGFASSVQFSHSVMSDSLRPHDSQHARPPCPSPTPRVYSNSCPLSR